MAGHLVPGDVFRIRNVLWKVLDNQPLPSSYEVEITAESDEGGEVTFFVNMGMPVEVE